MLHIILIAIPLVTATTLLFLGNFLGKKWVERVAIVGGALEWLFSMHIVFIEKTFMDVSGNESIFFDALGSWFLFISATIGFLGLCYSVSYLRRESRDEEISVARKSLYFALFHLFILSMFVAVGANNLLLLWIAVEATTLCTAFLINFFDRPAAIEAAWKYMIINTTALLLGLFGIFLFIGGASQGTPLITSFDWKTLSALVTELDVELVKIAFVFMLIGYGTKAGLAPLHSWLPDAHSQAPSPVSAMLSGALLNVAMLALLRFKGVVDVATGDDYTRTIMIGFGTTSMLIAALIMLLQKQYKRLLAYSSVEHIGVMAFGFGLGGVGGYAALLHALYHSIAKSMLFFASGNILLRFHSVEIKKIRGLIHALPVTGIIFLAGLLAIAGLPPFGIFMTEFMIFSSSFVAYPVYTVVALLSLAIAFVGVLQLLSAVSYGEAPQLKTGEDDVLGTGVIVVLFVLLVVTSIALPPALSDLLYYATLSL